MRVQPPNPRDALLPLAIAAALVPAVLIAPPASRRLDPLGWALLLAGALALAARRRAPVTVLLFTTACLVGYNVRGYPGAAAAFPMLIALYTAVRQGDRRVVLIPFAALAAGFVTNVTVLHGVSVRQALQDKTLLLGWVVAAAMMAMAFRQWEAYVREADQRAADAERTKEETARRRAAEERLRIARDLHDSLTHSISVITMQSGVAIHLARKRGEAVPEALRAIQDAGRDAARELRDTLDVLRRDDEPGGSGLDQLPALVRRAASTGLPATVTVTGERRDLPADVDRTAYRIVQEALTNVTRHARASSAAIRLGFGPAALTVEVEDDGCGTAAPGPVPGMGLIGMRERVTAIGGRLHVGPRPEGGFAVHAELPLPA